MSVDRYEPNSKASVTFNNFGWLVRYDDYQKLQAENKALKEHHTQILKEKYPEQVLSLQKKLIEVKKIRNELLEAVSQSEIVFRNIGHKEKAEMLVPIIQKAEALMEKEE